MKLIKPYKEFVSKPTNEKISYRSLSTFRDAISLPKILLDRLLSKILNYIPELDNEYKILSLKKPSTFDSVYSIPSKITDDLIKIDIDDIENDVIKRSLKLSGMLTKWNVYIVKVENDPNYKSKSINSSYTKMYITKDELKKGDIFFGERIGNYRYKSINIMLILCAKRTNKHDEIRKVRDEEYKQHKAKKSLTDFKDDMQKRMKDNKPLPSHLTDMPFDVNDYVPGPNYGPDYDNDEE